MEKLNINLEINISARNQAKSIKEAVQIAEEIKKKPCCNHDSKVGKKILTGLTNAIKDSFEDHKYNARDRYEYIKNMSKRVCDYLENERFGVTEEEYNVFLNVLKEELKFRLEH